MRLSSVDFGKATGRKGAEVLFNLMLLAGWDAVEAQRIAFLGLKLTKAYKDSTAVPPEIESMITRWYHSVREVGEPDYSIYSEPNYMAEGWACFEVYSRVYVKAMPKAPGLPRGDMFKVSPGGLVVDLGNGVGGSTAMLAKMIPHARVIGTNVAGSVQMKIGKMIGEAKGFEMRDTPEAIGQQADMVFASEYFEHFPDPLTHLREVLTALQPRRLLTANRFGPNSLGHFDSYPANDGTVTPGKGFGRNFADEMEAHGYQRVKTGLWNNTPAMWELR